MALSQDIKERIFPQPTSMKGLYANMDLPFAVVQLKSLP